jgi:hypothetical protein
MELETDILLVESILSDKIKYAIFLDYDVNVRWLSKDMQEVKDLLALFAKNGILLKYFTDDKVRPMWRLKGRVYNICLYPYWSQDESNACHIVKIGEDTTPRPIYKLICNDEKGGAETKAESSDDLPF